MKKLLSIALIITFQSCLGQYPKLHVDSLGRVVANDKKPEGYYDTTYEQGGVRVFIGNAGIYQPVDSAKYYYHKFLEFTRKMNNPKITRKKFDQYEDSCKRYFELLNRIAGRNLKEKQ